MKFLKPYSYCLSVFCLLLAITACQKETSMTIDLSGQWDFQMDSLDVGEKDRWYTGALNETITLPGSMVENDKGNLVGLDTDWTGNMWNDSLWYKDPKYAKYRQPDNFKISFWLQPNKKYYGAAWYQKRIKIPEDWKNHNITFKIERAHWESTIWIDDEKIGSQNLLGTPHKYTLENLSPGYHLLTVRMDNRVKDIDVGIDAHSISDNTQTNWNGLVGEITLTATPKVFVKATKITPDVKNSLARINLSISNSYLPNTTKANIKLQAQLIGDSNQILEVINKDVDLTIGDNQVSIDYPMGDNPSLWDEFDPNLYELSVILDSDVGTHEIKETFGMREFKADGSRFVINDRPLFLRGTLECSIFPLTGYPPTTVEPWRRIFKTIKDHGLNHMRFHSWCPPEAAFSAADELGIYLQVEASAWTTIGDGAPVDKWIFKEGEAILEAYGNHPSFVMMAYGNEPSGDHHKEYLTDFVTHFKKLDPSKMFTGAAGWPLIDQADFLNTPKPRIQQWNQNLNSIINAQSPQTVFDFQDFIDKTPMPVVSHEIGQWCVYPNFKEISKYTGVLKPKNFEIFQETLNNNNLGHLSDSLFLASGKLQALCYKADIEAALRTKDFAGFQLLDLHDFSGQGTALIGVLDAFWDEKGYISPQEFKSFSGETVPLARLEKRVFLNNEHLNVSLELAHFGAKTITNATPQWQLLHKDGTLFQEGDFETKNFEIGNGNSIGTLSVPLASIKKAEQLNLKVMLNNFSNDWDIWVYPSSKKATNSDIRVVEQLDPSTITFLNNGGSVLLNSSKGSVAPQKGGDIGIGFSSIFWNTSWTNGQKPHTLGILCEPEHPALAHFPTEYHSNWQWWDAMSHSNAIILDEFGPELKPIVRVIDDWFENRSLGLLFEVKIGRGKLLVSGIDLHTDLDKRIEAQQLLYSLKEYMSGNDFNPSQELNIEQIRGLYVSK